MLIGRNQQSGFTLVEMIIVMVITGIIGGMVAIFIRAPVQGYVDSARRAELSDIADTAIRRMARDVRIAVPNSVRTDGCAVANQCVEFIPTKDGGRYSESDAGNSLAFGSGSLKFDVVGDAVGNPVNVTTSDFIIVGSTQFNSFADPSNSPYNTAAAGVLRTVTAVSSLAGVQTITIGSSFPNSAYVNNPPLPPPQRFDVVDGSQKAVTYACETDTSANASDGQLKLVRRWNYWTGAGTPYAPYSIGGSSAILASKVSSCSFGYSSGNSNFALLTVLLTLNSNGESVSLYNEIHVHNTP